MYYEYKYNVHYFTEFEEKIEKIGIYRQPNIFNVSCNRANHSFAGSLPLGKGINKI